jgi:hypothetical protein
MARPQACLEAGVLRLRTICAADARGRSRHAQRQGPPPCVRAAYPRCETPLPFSGRQVARRFHTDRDGRALQQVRGRRFVPPHQILDLGPKFFVAPTGLG